MAVTIAIVLKAKQTLLLLITKSLS